MQVMRLMTAILGQLRCATTAVLSLLNGGARAVSADDRRSLRHSARHNPLAAETVRRTWLPKNSALPLTASRNMASTGAAECNRRAFRTNDQTVP